MRWYWIVLITYTVTCVITVILAQFKEDYAFYWAAGLPYLVMYVLFYPVRAWLRYDRYKEYYKKDGISRLQYILGKRVRD